MIDVLTLTAVAGVLAALALEVMGRRRDAAAASAALLAAFGALVFAGVLFPDYVGWVIPAEVSVDRVSLLFLANVVVVGVAAATFSRTYLSAYGESGILYYPLLLLFTYSMAGVVLASDWLTFLIFWEIMTFSSYLLIVYEHGDDYVKRAGTLYIITCHIGSSLLIAGIALLYAQGGDLSMSHAVPGAALAAWLMTAGFVVKAGLVPTHFWLPHAHPAAPSPVSALLSGAMVELGAYGLYRLLSVTWPGEVMGYAIAAAAVASSAASALFYWVQGDLKRVFAWSTIDNMGWVFAIVSIPLIAGYPAWVVGDLLGLYVLCHGIAKAAAFLSAGVVHYAYGTKDVAAVWGLGRRDPVTASALAASALAVEGTPPFSMFFPKIGVIALAFSSGVWALGVAFAVTWCAAFIYFVTLVARVYLRQGRAEAVRRPSASMIGSVAALLILSLATVAVLNLLGLGWWP